MLRYIASTACYDNRVKFDDKYDHTSVIPLYKKKDHALLDREMMDLF